MAVFKEHHFAKLYYRRDYVPLQESRAFAILINPITAKLLYIQND